MKKYIHYFCLSTILVFSSMLQAQNYNKEKLTFVRSVDIMGKAKVELRMGTPAIASKQAGAKPIYQLAKGRLSIAGDEQEPTEIVLWIDAGRLEKLNLSGQAIAVAYEALDFGNIKINAFDKSMLKLHLEAKDINVRVADEATIELSGSTNYIDAASGKSAHLDLDALDYNASYISRGEYKAKSYPAGDTLYVSTGGRDIYIVDNGEEASVKYGKVSVDIDGEENARVRVGSHQWVLQSDGRLKHTHYKSCDFDGHWSGLGLGINGFVHKDGGLALPNEDRYMKLLWNKSINVDINAYQYSLKLAKNANLGLVTGIGLSINNYRFERAFTVAQDSAHFYAYLNKGIGVKKTKMVLKYIQVPLLLEWHDKHPNPLSRHRWHLSAGLVLGMRIHAHQKTVFNETGKSFDLEDPKSGLVVATAMADKRKIKLHNNFDLQPFKADATVRMGWGIVNLYAQVALNGLFQSSDSPQLRPFTVGIMLSIW